MKTRTRDGVDEHRHEGADWWHPETRIHTKPAKRREGERFILTARGVGCGHWEGEPDTSGYRNACAECQEQNGECHVAEKVRELGGVVT